jgi:TRAP-type mannitol/chloroaromatic compound transport system permease small subunit
LERITRIIDNLDEAVGKVVAFAPVFIMIIQVIDVSLRYLFNRPTLWAWDVNAQFFVASAMLAGGYTLLHDDHVRLDLVYGRLTKRRKAILDAISGPVVILAFALLTWQLSAMALESWEAKERAFSTFSPPLYPLKTLTCIAAALLALQTIARWFKNIALLRKETPSREGA